MAERHHVWIGPWSFAHNWWMRPWRWSDDRPLRWPRSVYAPCKVPRYDAIYVPPRDDRSTPVED